MGEKRSNDNGGHKASDDVKTVIKSGAGTKHAEVVQVQKGTKTPKTTTTGGKSST